MTVQPPIELINAGGPVVRLVVPGFQGIRGFSVFSGDDEPTDDFGVDGDFYLRLTDQTLYAKAFESWGPPVELRGFSVLSGTGAPDNDLGRDGEFYIRTDTWDIYGPKTAGDWGSPETLIGPQGVAGLNVLSGSAVPDDGDGVDGEFYIRTGVWDIYGPKTAGAWGSATSLVGPPGVVASLGDVADVDLTPLPQVGSGFRYNGAAWTPTIDEQAGLRNRIINGGMTVDQRKAGAAQGFTAGAALAYCVDRWYGYCTGANVNGRRVQGEYPNLHRYRFNGASGVTAIGFAQRIEARNCADLSSRAAVLSVDLANSLLTTVNWEVFRANSADAFGPLASPTKTSIASGSFTVTGSVERYSALINMPFEAHNGLEVVFTVGAQTDGTWQIGNVQLEPGFIRTPFERRSHSVELGMCQRYYSQQVPIIRASAAGSGAVYETPIYYPAPMRVVPTAVGFLGASNVNLSSATIVPFSTGCARLITIAAGAGDAYSINGIALFDAEL